MDPTDELLALATGIQGYSLTLSILGRLREEGVDVPWNLDGRIGMEIRTLAAQWWTTTHGEPTFTTENLSASVRESREWLIEHGYEPVDLLVVREKEER